MSGLKKFMINSFEGQFFMKIKKNYKNIMPYYISLGFLGLLVFFLKKYTVNYFAELFLVEIILITIMTIIFFLNKRMKIKLEKESKKILNSFLLFIFIIFLNFIFRLNISNLKILFKYIEIFYVVLLVYAYISSWVKLKNILFIFLIFPSFISIFNTLYHVYQGEFSKMILSPAIHFLIFLYYFSNKKIFFNITLAYSISITLLSGSRTNFLLLILFLFFIAIKIINKYFKNKEKILLLLVFIFFIIIFSFLNYEILVNFFDIGKNTASNNERLRLITFSFDTIADNFLFGIGPGEFTKYWNMSSYSYFRTENLTAHNHFLQIFVEMGIIGFLTFILFIIKVFINNYKNKIYNYINTKYRNLIFGYLIIEFYYMILTPFSGYNRVRFAIIMALFLSLNKLEYNSFFKKGESYEI